MSKARSLADLGNVYDDGALSNRNLIINGAMQVAQRGSSGTVGAALHYVSDRWQHRSSAQVGGTTTYSQAVVNGQTRLRLNYSGATGSAYIQQAVEAQNLNGVWGKDVTISFYTTDASPSVFVFGYNASAVESTFLSQTAATSLGDNRWSVTFNLAEPSGGASTGTAYGMGVVIYPNGGSTPSDGDIDFWNVQLEVGDTATPFEHRSFGDELARCKRYYQEWYMGGYQGVPNTFRGSNSPSIGSSIVAYLPTMRADPTVTLTRTTTLRLYRMSDGATVNITTGLTASAQHSPNDAYKTQCELRLGGTADSGISNGVGYSAITSSGGYIDCKLDAEL